MFPSYLRQHGETLRPLVSGGVGPEVITTAEAAHWSPPALCGEVQELPGRRGQNTYDGLTAISA